MLQHVYTLEHLQGMAQGSQYACWQKIAAVGVVVVVFRHDDGDDDDDEGDAPATAKTGRFPSSQTELETFHKSASYAFL